MEPARMSHSMAAERGLDPWLSMWTQPRETVRHIVQSGGDYGVLLLAALGGVAQVLDRATSQNLGDEMSIGAILLAALVAGPIAGILGLYVFAWLLEVSGRWIGGRGSGSDLRAALAWGSLPNAAGLLLWIPALALAGREMFTASTPQLEAQPLLAMLLLPIGLIWIALAIWAFILILLAVAEVQRFSAWRALGNLLLGGVLFAVPFVVLGIVAALMTGTS